MPTGYTSEIANGISFQEFALNCARAFGACISLKEEPLSTPIPEQFKVDTYHDENLKKAINDLKEINLKTEKELKKEFAEEKIQRINSSRESLLKNKQMLSKYEKMLNKVKKFNPPSKNHIAYKNFMIEQIESSIKFDDMQQFYIDRIKEYKELNFNDWFNRKVESLKHDIEYHRIENKKEKSSTDDKNEWIRQLRDAIKKIK